MIGIKLALCAYSLSLLALTHSLADSLIHSFPHLFTHANSPQ